MWPRHHFAWFLLPLLLASAQGSADESRGSALTPVPIRETSTSVSVISRQDIERRGSPRLVDLLRTVPGVAVTETGPLGGVAQVRIRGAEGNHTLVVVDGVEVNDPSNSVEFDFANWTTEQIERVEVIRGPLSGFYGSNSIGGVVHITTREGRPGLHVSGSAEGGFYNTTNVASTVQTGGENWGGAFSFQSLRTDGESAADSGAERDGYKNLSVHGRGHWNPHEALRLDAFVHWDDAETEFDKQVFFSPAPPPFVGDVVNAQNETDPRHLYARTQAALSLFEGRLEQRAGVALTDIHRGDHQALNLASRTRGRRVKLDYQVSAAESFGAVDTRLTAQYEREETSFRTRSAFGRTAPPSETNHSVIGELRLGWDDRLFLNGTIRQDFNRRFEDARTYRVGASAAVPGLAGLRLRGGYGKAVVNPTFTEVFGIPPFLPPGIDLAPETSRGWDLGAEWQLPGQLGHVALGAYRTRLAQEIFFPGLGLAAVNLDRSKRQGVELETRLSPFDWLDIAASYTYARSRERQSGRYLREVRRPRHLASLILDARALDGKLSAQIGAVYRGRSNDLNFGNTPTSRDALDPVGLLHARVSYRVHPNLEIFVRGENLLDDDYEEVRNFESPGIQGLFGVRFNWRADSGG